MRILVADDDPVARLVVSSRLTKWGYGVVTAEDGTSALAVLTRPGAPRIALIDWMMPGLDGPDVCRRLRASASGTSTYVLLLTAREGSASVAEGLDAGANDYLTKPFDDRELRARLGVAARVVNLEDQLQARVTELQHALDSVARLEELLPICSYCHSVRQDDDYWQRLDQYVGQRGVKFSHSICPHCFEKHVEPQLEAMEA